MNNMKFKMALLAALAAEGLTTPAVCDVTDEQVVMKYNSEASDIGIRAWLAGQDAGLFYDDLNPETNEVNISVSAGGQLQPVTTVTIRRVSKAEYEAAKSELEVVIKEYRAGPDVLDLADANTASIVPERV